MREERDKGRQEVHGDHSGNQHDANHHADQGIDSLLHRNSSRGNWIDDGDQ